MNLSLINPNNCPPNGFRFVFPNDGFVCHAWTYFDWVEVAKAHLRANNIPVPVDLEDRMMEQQCQTLEPGWCKYDNPNRKRVSADLTWGDMVAGVQTFGRWLAGGLKTVEQSEAERRAMICARCYLNVQIDGCSTCQKLVTEVAGKLKTKHDGMLKGCAVCKCVLKVKVHLPIKTLLDNGEENQQEVFPEHCWLKKDSPNYRG